MILVYMVWTEEKKIDHHRFIVFLLYRSLGEIILYLDKRFLYFKLGWEGDVRITCSNSKFFCLINFWLQEER